MKFIVSSSYLLKMLTLLQPLAKNSSVLPILQSVLFKVTRNRVYMYASNLATSMEVVMDCEAREDASFCVPHKYIFDLVKNCPEQPLTLSLDNTGRELHVIGDNFEVILPCEKEDDFVKLPTVVFDKENNFTVTGKAKDDLFTFLQRSLSFVSTDDLRPSMTGVFLHSHEGKLRIVATDAHRLYWKSTNTDYAGRSIIVEPSGVRAVLSLFKNTPDAIWLQIDENNVRVTDGHRSVISRHIDAKYPDYQVALPTGGWSLGNISMIAKDMKRTIQLCKSFANGATGQINFEMDRMHIKYKATDVDFLVSATATCPVYDSDLKEGITMAFNGNFVLQIINMFKDDYIKLSVPMSPTKALVINDCVILMPLMLNN